MKSTTGKIWIITGRCGVGKTRFCANLVNSARKDGLHVEGVICPPGFTGQIKTSIEIENLKSGEQFRLARVRNDETDGLMTDHWIFDPKVMAWGNQILGETGSCDLLMIDELGPLEFKRSEGWQNGLKAIDRREFQVAAVVIRPGLLEAVCLRWPDAQVIDILVGLNNLDEERLQAQILSAFHKE